MAENENIKERPNAWLLNFGHGQRAAVGMRVLLQIIDQPGLHPVPCTPAHCRHIYSWQGRLMPVVDMAVLVGQAPQEPRLLAIAGYQEGPGEAPKLGALLLSAPPLPLLVGNDKACQRPELSDAWQRFSISCFDNQEAAVPVLHMGRVFAKQA